MIFLHCELALVLNAHVHWPEVQHDEEALFVILRMHDNVIAVLHSLLAENCAPFPSESGQG